MPNLRHTGFCPRHFIDDVNNRRYVQSHNRCPLKTHYQLRTFEKIVVSKYWPTLLQHIFVKLTHCCTQIRFINERLSKTMIGRWFLKLPTKVVQIFGDFLSYLIALATLWATFGFWGLQHLVTANFFKWAIPDLYSVYFRSLQTNKQNIFYKK